MKEAAKALGAECDRCPLRNFPGVVPAQIVNPKPRALALVTDFPGAYEIKKNQFLSGPTGEVVHTRILSPCSIPSGQLHITAARLCWDKKSLNAEQAKAATEACRPRLINELKRVKPEVILTTGPTACLSVLHQSSVDKVLGAICEAPNGLSDFKVVPTYQPAMMFGGKGGKWGYLPVFRSHFLRAWQLATGELTPWEWNRHVFKVNRGMLASLNRIAGKPHAEDIETYRYRGKHDHLRCEISVIGFGNGSGSVAVPWHGYIEDPQSALEQEIHEATKRVIETPTLKVFQNGRFDRFVLRRHGLKVQGRFRDTMLLHTMFSPRTPHSLEFQVAVEFHAPKWKQTHKNFTKDGFDK